MPTVLSILSASLLISTAPVTMQDMSPWRYTTDKKCRVVVCVHHPYPDAVGRYVLGAVILWDPSISTAWIRPSTGRCDSASSPRCKPMGSISRR